MKKPKKKRTKNKINKLLETTEKINYAQLLLKDLEAYLSTSVNKFTKFTFQELSDIIEEVQLHQIGLYMNTKKGIRKDEKNATFAYRETLDNCYLNTIRDLKKVITKAKQTYTTIYDRK